MRSIGRIALSLAGGGMLAGIALLAVAFARADGAATPAPAPSVSVSIPTDIEAELLCSTQGGTWSGHYGWSNGERVPVCVVP